MKTSSVFRLSILSALLGTLAACGGGGGSSSSSTSTSSTASGTTLNVTAATGDPIIGATITVIDGAGVTEVCSGKTDDSGQLACQLQNAKAFPFFIQAAKQSLLTYGVLPSASTTVNITPVSDLMARKVASDIQMLPSQIMSTPALMNTVTTAKTQTAVDVVTNVIQTVATATVGSLASNPLTGSFNPLSATDKLDVLIKNFPMNADSGAMNITVPQKSGAIVTVSVDLTTTNSTAAKDVAAVILNNNNVTVARTALDADPILAVADEFISKLSRCKDNPSLQPEIVQLMDPNATYSSGYTKAGWVADLCDGSLPGITRQGAKKLGRIGDTVIYFMGILQPSTNIYAETIFGFVKVGDSWKLAADELPVQLSDSVRHALALEFDTQQGSRNFEPKFSYERYMNVWIGTDDAQNPETGLAEGAAAPDRIQVFAMSFADAQAKAAEGNNFPTTPNYTLYRVANPGVTCGTSTNYTLFANRTSCSSFVQDKANSERNGDYVDTTDLFANILEKNELNAFFYKVLDANGNCTNCTTIGNSRVPKTMNVLGRAWKFKEIFGENSVSEASLRAGTVLAANANLGTVRSIYSAPTDKNAEEIVRSFYSNNLSTKFTLPWQKPSNNTTFDINLWGGTTACKPNSKWLDYSTDTFDIVGNSHTFTYGLNRNKTPISPEFGKTFADASYLQFALSTSIKFSEFVFYIQGSRNNLCPAS